MSDETLTKAFDSYVKEHTIFNSMLEVINAVKAEIAKHNSIKAEVEAKSLIKAINFCYTTIDDYKMINLRAADILNHFEKKYGVCLDWLGNRIHLTEHYSDEDSTHVADLYVSKKDPAGYPHEEKIELNLVDLNRIVQVGKAILEGRKALSK